MHATKKKPTELVLSEVSSIPMMKYVTGNNEGRLTTVKQAYNLNQEAKLAERRKNGMTHRFNCTLLQAAAFDVDLLCMYMRWILCRFNCTLLQVAAFDVDLFCMYMRWILCLEWSETTNKNSQRYGMLYLTLEFDQILQ